MIQRSDRLCKKLEWPGLSELASAICLSQIDDEETTATMTVMRHGSRPLLRSASCLVEEQCQALEREAGCGLLEGSSFARR